MDNPIDLPGLGRGHPLNRATRRIARYWPLIYSKLLCLEWLWDEGVPYGATDGIRLLLSRKGVDEMSQESVAKVGDPVGYVAFLLLHEGVHAILNHGTRLVKFTDRETANVAADYKVNEMVHQRNQELRKELGVKHDLFPLPEWVLLDTKLSTPNTTEKLYQHLRKDVLNRPQPTPTSPDNSPTQHPDGDQPTGGDCSDDYKEDGSGTTADDPTGDGAGGSGDPEPTQSPEPGTQNPDPSNATNDHEADIPQPIHDSGPGTHPVPRSGDGDPRPGAGGVDTFPPVAGEGEPQAELENSIEELNERLMVQDALDSNASGTESASTVRITKERDTSDPQDWADYAKQFVETRCEDGWMGVYNHAVYSTTGLCAPGREGKRVGDIICVADSSGSIGSEAWKKFFELNQYILDEVQPDRILLLSCAEEVKDHVILEAGDTVPISLRGGGGTSFKKAFDWVTDDPHNLCIDPLLLIYFTDGWAEDHKTMKEPEYPVLWLSYSKPKAHFPWGEFAKININ